MCEWKKYFDKERLDRGYDYYIYDTVYAVVLTDKTITAKVEGAGRTPYDVKINFKDNQIKSMYCTCPYAYSKGNCKHMVAVLYKKDEIIENKEELIHKDQEKNTTKFEDLLYEVDENKLRQFIYNKYKYDNNFIEEFTNHFKYKITAEDIKNYHRELEDIFSIDIIEFYNYHNYYEECPFTNDLITYINNIIDLLYKNNEYDEALKLLYSIYENIDQKEDIEIYIDVHNILESANKYLSKIIDKQDNIKNEEIFNYLLNKIRYQPESYVSSHLMKICFNKFNQKYQQKTEYDVINAIIKHYHNEDNPIPQDILIYKYNLMQGLKYPEAEINQFLNNNREDPKIMRILIDSAINNKEYQKAIELLNENKNIHGNLYSLQDSLDLINLYKQINDKEQTISEIKNIIYNYNIKEITYIDQLKELLSPDDWLDERKQLFEYYNNLNEYEYLNYLYIKEELYEELYQNIINNSPIEDIERYRQYYEEKHSDDILKIYTKHILDFATTAHKKGAYNYIIKIIKTMQSYPNNEEQVNTLIKTLISKYETKKLLIQKLRKIKV